MSHDDPERYRAVKITTNLDPEWHKAANELYKIIGYNSLEDFLSDCLKIRVESYIEGGSDSGCEDKIMLEQFRTDYQYLVEQGSS